MSSWTPLPEELQYFPNFLCYLLRELQLADRPTIRQLEVASWLQDGPRRSITCAYRGLGKSFENGAYAVWRLRCDPFNEKVLIPAATLQKCEEVATWIQLVIREIDILRCLEPPPGARSSVMAFDVANARPSQSPSVRIGGILSAGLTGLRCSYAGPDDIETLANTLTPLRRSRLASAVTELEAILFPADPGFDENAPIAFENAGFGQVFKRQIAYFGTPHLETSLYLALTQKQGYRIRFWPARYPDPADGNQWGAYRDSLSPYIAREVLADPSLVGQPTDPERFGHEELLEREIGMGTTRAQLQFQLNTRLSTLEKYPIRLGDLVVMDLDGKALPAMVTWGDGPDRRIQSLDCVGMGADSWYHSPAALGPWVAREEHWSCVLYIDPAARGSNELAWAVVAELHGNLFLLEVGGTPRGYESDVLVTLANVAKRWQVSAVENESNMGHGMFSALLRPVLEGIYPCSVTEVHNSMMKEQRLVDVLSPVVQSHRLVVSKSLIRADAAAAELDPETGQERSVMFQLSRLLPERNCLAYNDRADAVAGAVAHFTAVAAQNQAREAEAREREAFMAEAEALLGDISADFEALARGLAVTASRRRYRGSLGPERVELR